MGRKDMRLLPGLATFFVAVAMMSPVAGFSASGPGATSPTPEEGPLEDLGQDAGGPDLEKAGASRLAPADLEAHEDRLKGTLLTLPASQEASGAAQGLPYSEGFEEEPEEWTLQGLPGLWHHSDRRSGSGDHSMYYGLDLTGSYDTLVLPNWGRLVSPEIDLDAAPGEGESVVLGFWQWFQAEGCPYEHPVVQVSTEGPEGPWHTVWEDCGIEGEGTAQVDLGSFVGQTVQVGFFFDTIDEVFNDLEGWYVDDVSVDVREFDPCDKEPSNDQFECAREIPDVPATLEQSTMNATLEHHEPQPCGLIGRTVWYSYPAVEDGPLVADTFGSHYDTVLAVYTGDDLGSLDLVGCNDDAGGTLLSEVEFNAQAGETYHLQLGGFAGSAGSLVLNLGEPGGSDPPEEGDRHEGAGEGPGWAMYQVESDGGGMQLEVRINGFTDLPVAQLSRVIYDEDLNMLSAFTFTAFLGGDDGIYVDSTEVGDGGPLVDTHEQWSSGGGMGLGSRFSQLEGTFYVLLWATGGVSEREYSLSVDSGGQMVAVEEDETAYSFVTRDFEGPLVAHASLLGLGAQVVLDGALAHEVESRLVGSFSFFGTGANVLSMQRPDGSTQICSCYWFDLNEGGEGPGNYTFRATGASGVSPGNLFVNVVDVRVPEAEEPEPPEPPEPVEPDETHVWHGFIGCSLNYPSAFEPWNCPDENSDTQHNFTVQPGLKTLAVAMVWEPVDLCTAEHLRHWLFVPADAPRAAERAEGTGPLEYRVDAGDPMEHPFEEIEEPTDLRFQVWGPTNGLQFCYQQPFEVHYHLFYEEHAQEGYSALPSEDGEAS